MSKYEKGLIASIIFLGGFIIGLILQTVIYPLDIGDRVSANETVILTEYVYIPFEKEVIREVETVKPLREFKSVDELRDWVTCQDLGLHAALSPDGKVTYNCDAYAESLYNLAYAAGYKLWPCPVNDKYLNFNHCGNVVFIGNQVFFIEPQTNEIKHVANRD